MFKKIILLLLLNFAFFAKAQNTLSVNSQNTFDAAINNASSGDTIEWENGTYSNIFMDITIPDITVQAATPGSVIFNGASRVEIDSTADNVVFTGFQYVGGDIGTENVAEIFGNNVLFENINIAEYSSYKYLIIDDESQFATIRNCNFEHRVNTDDINIVSILVSETQPGFHTVQYCSFKNFEGEPSSSGSIGDAGVEPIRIGVFATANFESKTVVEFCYFTRCNGDGEIISHKATSCIYRYNTFENNPNSELVLRHGDQGIVYGNYFLNSMGGVRIQEASNHVIYNNYFNNLSKRSVSLKDDDSDPVENVLVAHNTFVNSADVILSGGSDTQQPTGITLANNIFSNTNNNDLIEDATGNETWIGNIFDGTLGITLPSSGLTAEDPDLSLNSDGFYDISSTSFAIDNAEGGFPNLPVITDFDYDSDILLDISINSRPSNENLKDIGAQEFTNGSTLTPHATEENTGPSYTLANSSSKTTSSFEKTALNGFDFYPNPLVGDVINFNFAIESTSDVKIDLYNIAGQKINTLINETYQKGNYTYNDKVDLNDGLYFLRVELTTGNTTIVKTQKISK